MNTRHSWMAARAAWPAPAWAGALRTQTKAPVVIGLLNARSHRTDEARLVFHDSMAALGWKHGVQYVVEERSADGRLERLPALAQEIAATNPAVILVSPSASARAAAAAAPTTPSVLVNGDPLTTGLVKSLARPEGLITGLSNVSSDLNLKVLQMLVESVPKLRRIGFLADATAPTIGARVDEVRRAAEQLRVEAVIVDMAKPADIEPAMARLAKERVQALVILASGWFAVHQAKSVQLALVQRWPVVSNLTDLPRHGGLFSYRPEGLAMIRRSAYYIDRILKGAKPGDMPSERPTRYELVINLKTAKALGLRLSQELLLRADEVIE